MIYLVHFILKLTAGRINEIEIERELGVATETAYMLSRQYKDNEVRQEFSALPPIMPWFFSWVLIGNAFTAVKLD